MDIQLKKLENPILRYCSVSKAHKTKFNFQFHPRKHGYSLWNFSSRWHRTQDTPGGGSFTPPPIATYVLKIPLQH